MSINQLQSEILTIDGVPDTGMLAAVTGTTKSFLTIANGIAASTVTLTRKPSGSAAAVSSGSVTFDLPGVYVLTVAAAGMTRNITCCVWPAAIFNAKISIDGRTVTIAALQGAVSDPRFSIATAEAALEVSNPTPDRWTAVWVGNQPVVWSFYS